MRGDMIDRLDGELRMERIETTRLIGGSLRALQDEARRLGIGHARCRPSWPSCWPPDPAADRPGGYGRGQVARRAVTCRYEPVPGGSASPRRRPRRTAPRHATRRRQPTPCRARRAAVARLSGPAGRRAAPVPRGETDPPRRRRDRDDGEETR